MIATCHTFGRNLSFHVHAHLLVTEGALQIGGAGQPVRFFSGHEYRKRWQYHLLTKLRKARPADPSVQRTIGRLFRKYPTGSIVNFQTSYPSARRALSYCCRYLARPSMGERRTLAYDGRYVTFQYKDYKTGGQCQKRCGAQRFVTLLLQHVLPRYAHNIHYYGLYRPQARRHWFDQARRASRHPEKIGGEPIRPLTWRQRILAVFKTDPVLCPNCGIPMLVRDIQLPARRRGSPSPRTTAKQRRLQLTLPLTLPTTGHAVASSALRA